MFTLNRILGFLVLCTVIAGCSVRKEESSEKKTSTSTKTTVQKKEDITSKLTPLYPVQKVSLWKIDPATIRPGQLEAHYGENDVIKQTLDENNKVLIVNPIPSKQTELFFNYDPTPSEDKGACQEGSATLFDFAAEDLEMTSIFTHCSEDGKKKYIERLDNTELTETFDFGDTADGKPCRLETSREVRAVLLSNDSLSLVIRQITSFTNSESCHEKWLEEDSFSELFKLWEEGGVLDRSKLSALTKVVTEYPSVEAKPAPETSL